MKIIICFISILTLMAFVNEKQSINRELRSDKFISKYFNDEEIVDLGKIIYFFESQICEDKSMSKEKCYYSFNKNVIEEAIKEIEIFKINIDYNLQKRLYTKIDSSFFKEIWIHPTYSEDMNLKNKVTNKFYDLNQFGKYVLFLKSLGDKDELFKDFYKQLSVANETSFGIQASAFLRFRVEEFKGIKRRLFFAIYYLTISDKMHNYKS